MTENKNAEKQRRYRERQKLKGKKEIRGYISAEAQQCYDELAEKSGWNDSELLSNALRLAYASYRCGQIKLLNEWLKDNKR